MSVEIMYDGVFELLPENIAAEVKAAFAKGRRGRVKECTVIADSQLALELYKLLYHKHNITPTEEYFDRAYTGYIIYIIRVDGKV
ncbi:hypothetical protein, partial [Pyrobaculum sp.]|uniref:hypothetical protein n=1 Tax=Pyrobaculum sp. TaxID=2004705 RepID=UPI0031704EE7